MSADYVAAHKAKKEAQAAKLSPIPGLIIANDGKKKKKKNKSKSVDGVAEDLAKTTISRPISENGKQANSPCSKIESTGSPMAAIQNSAGSNATVQSADPAKRLKNLKKKLREIETLEQKIKGGELKNPEKEMLDKVSRKSEVLKEIQQLEA